MMIGQPTTDTSQVTFLEPGEGRRLAFSRAPGQAPEIVFLPGFRSDMGGTKATFLDAHARARQQAFTRFDYRGHGQSSGRFEDGCIGDWLDDVLAILDQVAQHPLILVGSSMGAWLALLAGLARPERLRGLVLIAAAPDFTARLIEPALDPTMRAALASEGHYLEPSDYGPPVPITRRLIEDGRLHLIMTGAIPLNVPVHLLHGQNDADVPWTTALELAAQLASPAVTVELVKDGDHRLSRDVDLKRLAAAVDRLLEQAC